MRLRWLNWVLPWGIGWALYGCDGGTPEVTAAAAGSAADAPSYTGAPEESAMTEEPRIPLTEVVKIPQPGLALPTAIAFDPAGEAITYLWSPAGSLTRALYHHDLGSGERTLLFEPPEGGATEANLSAEEKLQRERRRERGLGVTDYTWAKQASRFVVPVRGEVWVQDGPGQPPRKLVESDDHPALDARLSRDGAFVAYVQDDELYVVDANGGASDTAAARPLQLSSGARGTGKSHGLAEYIAQEEMGRQEGFWWSRDGQALAYTEVDETHIPAFRIVHQGKDAPSFEDHGYPFAGEPNAKVKLGVVPRRGGRTVWMDLTLGDDPSGEFYLGRVHWMPDGSLMAELEDRAQSRLDLVRFDVRTGRGTPVLSERSEVWINLHNLFEPLEEGELAGGFVWGSERSGFMHLYLYDKDGTLVRPLTAGEWMIESIEGIDEARGAVYVTGTRDGPLERQLYRVPLAGGELTRLTTGAGMHSIVMDEACERYVDTVSSVEHPPKISVHRTSGEASAVDIALELDPRIESFGLTAPELVSLRTRDGVELHGALYKPAGEGPWPVLVSVYGGPHAQRVQNAWSLTADMRAQSLRQTGILVWKLDNRGSARRGLAFEGALRHDMGNLEVQDQVDGVNWLREQGLVEGDRVAIQGWSYGGYMAAMALGRAPETFKVAVAGAPVTRWDGYDTHYTERYMGTPQTNPEGYEQSAVMTHVPHMKGALLLVHGLIDENVHFRHTARLINALVAAGKDYELLMFPDERHMPRAEADRVYMESRIRAFLEQHL